MITLWVVPGPLTDDKQSPGREQLSWCLNGTQPDSFKTTPQTAVGEGLGNTEVGITSSGSPREAQCDQLPLGQTRLREALPEWTWGPGPGMSRWALLAGGRSQVGRASFPQQQVSWSYLYCLYCVDFLQIWCALSRCGTREGSRQTEAKKQRNKENKESVFMKQSTMLSLQVCPPARSETAEADTSGMLVRI